MLRNDKSCDKPCLPCRLYTRNKKIAPQKVDAVTGVSKFIPDTHIKHDYFKNVKIRIISKSIEKINKNFVKEKNKNLVFGYFGLISSIKGVELLLQTFKKVNNNNIKLLLAGNENEPNYISKLKEKYLDDRISFVGFVKPEEFFSSVDVLIHPTLWFEPFARSIIEAFSYKVPVIASYKGGNIEAIKNNKTGFLFKNADELFDQINYFIDNRSIIEDMKENCINEAKYLLVDNIVDSYIKIYDKLL